MQRAAACKAIFLQPSTCNSGYCFCPSRLLVLLPPSCIAVHRGAAAFAHHAGGRAQHVPFCILGPSKARGGGGRGRERALLWREVRGLLGGPIFARPRTPGRTPGPGALPDANKGQELEALFLAFFRCFSEPFFQQQQHVLRNFPLRAVLLSTQRCAHLTMSQRVVHRRVAAGFERPRLQRAHPKANQRPGKAVADQGAVEDSLGVTYVPILVVPTMCHHLSWNGVWCVCAPAVLRTDARAASGLGTPGEFKAEHR